MIIINLKKIIMYIKLKIKVNNNKHILNNNK